MAQIGLKQFRAEGCLTYALFDAASRLAAVVDPHMDTVGDVREYLRDHGLKLVWVLDTHIHADHYSASHLLRDELGAQIAMSDATRSERVQIRLRHRQELELGSFRIQALSTPGHTPDSMAFFVAGEPGLVFTGDTLLIGCTGRTDFPQADPSAMWTSLQETLMALPPQTLVLPGHDYNDLLFSTLETERRSNPHLQTSSRDLFVEMKKQDLIANPASEIAERVQFNLTARPAGTPHASVGSVTACGIANLPESGSLRAASINVEKYQHKLQEHAAGQLFVDVREPEEFGEARIPGTRNIPLSELALHLDELRAAERIYVSCLSGRRSSMAAKTLCYLGIKDVVNVTGGFKAWSQAGLRTEGT